MVRLLHRIGLSEVLNVDPRGFYQLDAMQGNGSRQNRLEFIPDPNDQVFNGAHFTPHEVHIQVQVTVIKLFNDVLPDNHTQFLYIKNKTGVGMRLPLYGNIQVKIVPMPVFVGTFTKNGIVLLRGPVRIVQLVRCVEMF